VTRKEGWAAGTRDRKKGLGQETQDLQKKLRAGEHGVPPLLIIVEQDKGLSESEGVIGGNGGEQKGGDRVEWTQHQKKEKRPGGGPQWG